MVREVLDMYFNLDVCKYYEGLPERGPECYLNEKKNRIRTSESTYNTRYNETPKLSLERTCSICNSYIEDEFHTIFVCPLSTNKYDVLLLNYPSVNKILNPTTVKDADIVGSMLSENLQ